MAVTVTDHNRIQSGKLWTVVSHLEDTGQVFSRAVKARDAHHAMKLVANGYAYSELGGAGIIGAFPGKLGPICPPCEDSGKSASAIDLCE